MGGACSTNGSDVDCIHVLAEKLEGKRQLGRSRRRQEHNVRLWTAFIRLGAWPTDGPTVWACTAHTRRRTS
jgi:hypothetical protein